MHSAFRAVPWVVIASIGIDAHAKTVERCVLSLEAKPTAESMPVDRLGKPRCPIAVVYPAPGASDVHARGGPSQRSGSVDPEARLADPSDVPRDSIAPQRPMPHV